MKNPVPGLPSHWLAYVLVDDVAALTKKAKSLGARIVNDVTEIPGYGSFSITTDPTGASIVCIKGPGAFCLLLGFCREKKEPGLLCRQKFRA